MLHLPREEGTAQQSAWLCKTDRGNKGLTSFVIDASLNKLMVTAMVNAYDRNKRPVPCRILIDTCSTANFITEDLATILRLWRKRCNMSIGALNGLATRSSYLVSTTIKSRYNGYSRTLEFLTVPRIASEVPDTQINRAAVLIPSNIYLADPDFHKPALVQMLISARTALSLLSVGQINLSSPGGPDLYLRKLNWSFESPRSRRNSRRNVRSPELRWI